MFEVRPLKSYFFFFEKSVALGLSLNNPTQIWPTILFNLQLVNIWEANSCRWKSKISSGTQQVRPKKHNKLWKICLHNEPNTAHNFCEIFMITLWSFCLYIAWQGAKQAIHDLWIFYAFIIYSFGRKLLRYRKLAADKEQQTLIM